MIARRTRRLRLVVAAVVALAAAAVAVAILLPRRAGPHMSRDVCVYASEHISILHSFSRMVGRDVECAVVYNDASTNWQEWSHPWFLHQGIADMNWSKWLHGGPPGRKRRLIVTQNLFPSSVTKTDWLHAGARGDFTGYAKTLAETLVRAGAGDAVVRLGHEANGTWYQDSLPGNPAGDALWAQFWRKTALAMKSVPGAHFQFDWTVNAAVRPIPLAQFYPGDDVVNIVGVDAYDVGVQGAANRWPILYGRRGGLGDVVRFARAHHKQLSIPEWGIQQAGGKSMAGGDDPAYVDGIAAVVRRNDVAYQSYFYSGPFATQLGSGPRSLAAYKRHFGSAGDSAPPP